MKKVMLLFFVAVFCASISCGALAVSASEDFRVKGCKAAYLCDWRSGTEVYSQDAEKHLPIASMCKIMTLLLCFENIEAENLRWDEQIAVSKNASGMGGSQVFLEEGGVYSVEDLVESICIASANDSCVAMAERIAGSEELFVKKMNERAKELCMEDTVFVNCTGLPQSGQYSCAKDVAAMLSALLHHEKYFEFSKIRTDEFEHSGGRITQMANTNKLIRNYVGCDSGKTGYTAEAGHCLAASALRGNLRVISVVIGATDSQTRFDDVSTMFDYAFANFTSKVVFEEGVLPDQACSVTGGKSREIAVKPAQACYIFCSRDDNDEIFYEIEWMEVKAPVNIGNVVGTAVVYKNNVEAARISLLSNENVAKLSYLDSLQELARNWNF